KNAIQLFNFVNMQDIFIAFFYQYYSFFEVEIGIYQFLRFSIQNITKNVTIHSNLYYKIILI
ncbi:MAG TPA: hypothetical protein DEU03_00190, partial [Bacillus sp. (in: Bacteria)]|nr:hypothetical protein [Bacillus sp. (in: firmicutes)]